MNDLYNSPILKILNRARWAPSGDNIQPWRFRVMSDMSAEVILLADNDSILAIDNMALLQSFGAFIETTRIAATIFGYRLDITTIPTDTTIQSIKTIRMTLVVDANIAPDPLHSMIEIRSVARGLYVRRRLSADDRAALQQAVGHGFDLIFLEGRDKRRLFKIHWINNKIRMFWHRIFDNYRRTIVWSALHTSQYLPSHALGMSPPTHMLFKHLLKSWRVFQIIIQYGGGFISSFIEIDLMPNIFCAANILFIAKKKPSTDDDFIAAGAAIQRFWLTAQSRGILHQPNFLPLAMNAHAVRGIPESPDIEKLCRAQRAEWVGVLGDDSTVDRLVWTGRIGYGTLGPSRSLRLPLDELMIGVIPAKAGIQ